MVHLLLVALLLTGCEMSRTLVGCDGLWTDPNPVGPVPSGAMKEALNVVIRRKGIAEPRPGFGEEAEDADLGSTGTIVAYDGDLLVENQGGLKWESDSYTDPLLDADGSGVSLAVERGHLGHLPHAEARGNLYFIADDGLHKVSAGGDAASQFTRIAPPVIWYSSANTAGSMLDAETAVAYRVTAEREDANGVITVSPPSGRFIFGNHHASNTYRLTIQVYFDDLLADDIVRLYRSAPVTSTPTTSGTPSDELVQVLENTITATDVSNGYTVFTDDEADRNGIPLYTSPTRQGLANANDPPPLAADMAEYKGSVFYANTYKPQRMVFALNNSYEQLAANQSGNATGIGVRGATGDIDTSSYVISNVSDTTGLQIGMIVIGGMGAAGPTVITNISGTDVTVDTYPTSTQVGQALLFHDSVRVEDNYYAVSRLEANIRIAATGLGDAPIDLIAYSVADEYRINMNAAAALHYPYSYTRKVLTQRSSAYSSSFTVHATHGDEYDPPLPLPEETGKETEASEQVNALYYSKRDQPEHVPVANYELVGAASHPIQRIIAGSNSLWVFKTDGIFRLTGAAANVGWSVTRVSNHHALIRRTHCTELEGSAYAWTNQGIIRVNDAGITPLSRGVMQDQLDVFQEEAGIDDTTANNLTGAWVNPATREVMFSDDSDYIFVWSENTKTWVRWEAPEGGRGQISAGVWNPANGLLYLAHYNQSSGSSITKEAADVGTGGEEWDSELQWLDLTTDPGVKHRYRDVAILFEDQTDITSINVRIESTNSGSADTQTRTISATGPGSLTAPAPRAHALTERLSAKIVLAGGQDADSGVTDSKGWKVAGVRFNAWPESTVLSR